MTPFPDPPEPMTEETRALLHYVRERRRREFFAAETKRLQTEDLAYAEGWRDAAFVIFGLIAMAEAIRDRCTCPPDWIDTEDGTRVPIPWEEVCERCKGYP